MIPYGKQQIDEEDIAAVVRVLQSDYLTQGVCVPEFEAQVAKKCGALHGVAVNSATSALHLACLALGLGEGDWLWTSSITFVASANAGVYCGAKVDFVDIDSKTYNISIEALEVKLKVAEHEGVLPKILVAVHLSGQPCDMERIADLARQYGFFVIEDASHAIGAKYKEQAVGCCLYSDITVFSFHPVKIITSAEGGMALTNNPELAKKITLLRSHGVTRDQALMTCESEGEWYYQQIDLGFNYRMTELQGALGLSQLGKLDKFIAKRKMIAENYLSELAGLPIRLPYQADYSHSSWHLFIIRLKIDEIRSSHKEIFHLLRGKGIGVNLHYIPVHKQPFYANKGWVQTDYPEAMAYYREAISIPIYHGLSEVEQGIVIETIKEVLS